MDRTPHDEWIQGHCPQTHRHYMIHTVAPRFIAEIFDEDDPEGILSGLSYELPDGRSLGNLVFDDDVPAWEALVLLLGKAGNVLTDTPPRRG